MAGPEKLLHGTRVLVTRPAHQAESLCKKIEAAGGEAIRFPALAIADPLDRPALAEALQHTSQAEWAIFVSPNAVARGLPLLNAQSPTVTLRYAAIGAATAQALRVAGVPEVLTPATRFDSEGLLECLPADLVTGKTVLLFRGEGGRQLIAETLAARGAQVLHAVCYRRVRPSAEPAALAHILQGEVDVIVVTSREALENLLVMVPEAGQAVLRRTPLVVTSARQAESARARGFTGPVYMAGNTGDSDILNALGTWRG